MQSHCCIPDCCSDASVASMSCPSRHVRRSGASEREMRKIVESQNSLSIGDRKRDGAMKLEECVSSKSRNSCNYCNTNLMLRMFVIDNLILRFSC